MLERAAETMNLGGQDLAPALIALRRKFALSQEDLARRLGVSFATVNRWENRRTQPSKLAIARLEAFHAGMVERAGSGLDGEHTP